MIESVDALEWEGLKAGGRRDFFIAYGDQIGKFIEANKLKPVSASRIFSPLIDIKEAKAASIISMPSVLIPWWYRGGKRFAHFHYAGDAYVLTDKQWQDFSTEIIGVMSNKLAASNSISFNGMLDITDAMSGMNSVI